MDELATAAAAVAIATDAYAEKDSELGLTFTTYMDVEAQEAAEERINVDKENDISIPAEREVQAGNPKIAAPEGRWHVPRGPGSSESHG
jgi:hypothetical protein